MIVSIASLIFMIVLLYQVEQKFFNGKEDNNIKQEQEEKKQEIQKEAEEKGTEETVMTGKIPLDWEKLSSIPKSFDFSVKIPEQAEENKLWESVENSANGVERIVLWENLGKIFLSFELTGGKGYHTLMLYEENEASDIYLESLKVREYQNVCGTNGYFVEYLGGAGVCIGAYYGIKKEMLEPVLLCYNGIYEADYDEDGEIEVINTYGTCQESWIYDYREGEIWQCSLNLLLEKKLEELTGIKRKSSVSYKSEKGQFEYSILPEEGMRKREERGLFMIQSAGDQLVLKMEEYLEE